MKINIPNIEQQKIVVFEESTKEAIAILKKNLKAQRYPSQTELDENLFSNTHLLREREGWEAPHRDIVGAYFRHFQELFPEYKTDKKLSELLGLSSDRRIREFKQGVRKVPFNIWRHFLVLTGRAPQDVVPVFGFLG
mgnify:CR=1 FL=1